MSIHIYIPLTQERKFLVFRMDGVSGRLSLTQDIDLPAQPWQLCASPDGGRLYQQVRDSGYSGIMSFRTDRVTGHATQIGEVELEADACYVSTDRTGRFLLAAYLFPGMVTVHSIDENGAVRGPAVERRETALYAHCIATDRSNRFVFVPHVTPTDAIYRFQFDQTTGRLTPCATPSIETPRGHGPRHIAFHPTLDILYANAEQASRADVYRIDPARGTLEPIQSLPTFPEDSFNGKNSTGTIRVHPSGFAVYVSNRGHDSIASFAADPRTGLLSPSGHEPTGPCPRTLGIDPDGRFLFAGSDDTGRVSTYRIEQATRLDPQETYDLGMWPSWILPMNVMEIPTRVSYAVRS